MTVETILVTYGPLGIFAAWMMFRVERRLEHVSAAMDGLTRGILIEVITRRDVPKAVEREARALLNEIAARNGQATA